MKKRTLFLACFLMSQSLLVLSQEARLMPSEAIAIMYHRTDMNPDKSRDINTKPIQPLVITEGLEGDELFYLGETYFWNLMPKESFAAFSKIKDENTIAARAAWQRIFIININGFQKFEETEGMLSSYREKFKPLPADRLGAFYAVSSLAYLYNQQGKHDKVVQLIKEEIEYLNYEGPYDSFALLYLYKDSFEEEKQVDELRKMTQEAHDGLKASLEQRKKNVPEKDIRYAEHSAPVAGMLTVMTEKLGYAQTNEKYEKLIEKLAEAL